MTSILHCSKEEIKNNFVAYPVPGSRYTSRDNTDPILESKPRGYQIRTIRAKKTARYTFMVPKESKNFVDTDSVITAECYMIDNERFAVKISSYLSPVIEVFKTVNSKLYETDTNIWSFHLKDYKSLIKNLLELDSNICIIQIPASVIQLFKESYYSTSYTSLFDLLLIDETLRNELMPFQEEGIRYGISRKGRCIIADELGKTIQGLGIARYFQESWPLLIIAPSCIRYQWFEAVSQYLPSIPAHHIQQFTNSKDFIDDVKIVIVSYNILIKSKELFKRRGFEFVILDESHVIKNKNSVRFKAVQDVISNSRHLVLLSKVSDFSRPIELYDQINLVLPNFMKYHEYKFRYCKEKETIFGWDFYRSSYMQELQLLLKSTCMIKRLKVDVLSQLPPKIRKVIILNTNPINECKEREKVISKEFNSTISSGLPYRNILLRYYNQSGFIRLKAVCDYVTRLFLSKRKCLILAHHKCVLDAILSLAMSMGLEFVRIDRYVDSSNRRFMINHFENYEKCLVAIVSITAANADIIPASRLVVFAELFWNPEILYRIENRVQRMQNDSVIIKYLVAKGTIDDHLWLLFKKKINTLSEVDLSQNNAIHDGAEVTDQIFSKQDQLQIDNFMENPLDMSLEGNDEMMDISIDEINVDKSVETDEREKKEETTIENVKELLNSKDEDLK